MVSTLSDGRRNMISSESGVLQDRIYSCDSVKGELQLSYKRPSEVYGYIIDLPAAVRRTPISGSFVDAASVHSCCLPVSGH